MIHIEPISTITFKANSGKSNVAHHKDDNHEKNSTGFAVASLTAFTALFVAATIGLVKTRTSSFENALKKAGVEIKDNIAKINSGERFTGKIEHFETRNKKEVVVYADGIIKERVYYNAFGKELSGVFYKDGMPKIGVGNITRRGENAYYTIYEYNGENIISRGDAGGKCNGSVFDVYRKQLIT